MSGLRQIDCASTLVQLVVDIAELEGLQVSVLQLAFQRFQPSVDDTAYGGSLLMVVVLS